MGVVFADALGSSQVNVNGATVFRAVIGSAHHQVLYSFGVFLSSAIQVNVASAGHSQAESRFVILALQSIELLKGMLNIGEKFSDLIEFLISRTYIGVLVDHVDSAGFVFAHHFVVGPHGGADYDII